MSTPTLKPEPADLHTPSAPSAAGPIVFWRVEGSLADLAAVRSVAYFTWNAQSFAERWTRRGGLAALALARPALFLAHKRFATRVLHTLLRGVTRDRLDLLGEEYFEYVLKPQLKSAGVEKLKERLAAGDRIVLVSQGLDVVMRPLARFLGVDRVLTNRLEFRDGVATGRLLPPMISPRGPLALMLEGAADGRIAPVKVARSLKKSRRNPVTPEQLAALAEPSARQKPTGLVPIVLTDHKEPEAPLSVRETLRGKHLMLIGVTGFIGKVWLAQILTEVPDVRENLFADSPAALDHLRAAL